MQKWSPEPFDLTDPAIIRPGLPEPAFQEETAPSQAEGPATVVKFRSECGFVDRAALMSHLTREERGQVFELVELEVAEVYENREKALKEEMQANLDQTRSDHETALSALTEALERTLSTHLQETAAASARLAVQLAEKIVRASVKIDREALTRSLETTFFKIQGQGPVSVDVNPEDARWLDEHPEICEKLNLATINRDRRIEQGGCVVRADQHTWDATLASQLESLTEVVEEMIAKAEPGPPQPTPEPPHEPGLD